MNRFVVVTDSTANLPPDLVSEYGVPLIPLTVHWGEETYLDGVSLDAPTFYRWLQERSAFPTTSQPSPGAFIEFFRAVAQKVRNHEYPRNLHLRGAKWDAGFGNTGEGRIAGFSYRVGGFSLCARWDWGCRC